MDRLKIKEAIVVEGRDDAAVVSQAADGLIIQTHGFGINKRTWALLEKAYKEKGLIILTDPDHAGEQIRKQIEKRFPGCGHAYMPRRKAVKNGDVGVENARPEDVAAALQKVCTAVRGGAEDEEGNAAPVFSPADLSAAGLSGGRDSAALRQKVGELLGIGYGNGGAFLKKLNDFAVGKEDFARAVAEAKKDLRE